MIRMKSINMIYLEFTYIGNWRELACDTTTSFVQMQLCTKASVEIAFDIKNIVEIF